MGASILLNNLPIISPSPIPLSPRGERELGCHCERMRSNPAFQFRCRISKSDLLTNFHPHPSLRDTLSWICFTLTEFRFCTYVHSAQSVRYPDSFHSVRTQIRSPIIRERDSMRKFLLTYLRTYFLT